MIFWIIATFKEIKKLPLAQTWLKNEGKEESILTHGLILMLLEHTSSKHGWNITKKHSGQPIATSQTGTQPYNISLSHSNEWAACVISDTGPIGIDIESHKPRDFNKLARFGFGEMEQRRIQEKGEDEFYKTWVLREAYAKMYEISILSILNNENIITNKNDIDYWQEEKANFFHKKINKKLSLGIASEPSKEWNKTYLSEINLSDLFKGSVLSKS